MQQQTSNGGFKANLTEHQAMELEMFRATHRYHHVTDQLSKIFIGYLGSDESTLDEPQERQEAFETLNDVQRLLRTLL